MPIIHTYFDNHILAQNVFDIIHGQSTALDEIELNLAERYAVEVPPTHNLLQAYMLAILENKINDLEKYLLDPMQPIKKNISLLLMHVKIIYDDKSTEITTPLKYILRTDNTLACALVEKIITEHCPELMSELMIALQQYIERAGFDSQDSAKEQAAITRIINHYPYFSFNTHHNHLITLGLKGQLPDNKKEIVVTPGQLVKLAHSHTPVVLLGIKNDYVWYKHPDHRGLHNTHIMNLITANLHSPQISAQELLTIIFENSNYLSLVIDKAFKRTRLLEPLPKGPKIGEGSDGTVYQSSLHNNRVAVKTLKKPQAREELIILTHINDKIPTNELLVSFCGYFVESTQNFVFEYMNHGDLENFIKHPKRYEFDISMLVIERVASALKLLHSYHIIHRDVKPANIFVHKTTMTDHPHYSVKLGDFGFSIFENWHVSISGTPYFLAPELLILHGRPLPANKQTTNAADMYAFGMVVWYLINGKTQIYRECKDIPELIEQVCIQKKIEPHHVKKNDTLARTKMAAINSWCTKYHQNKRATAAEIVDEFDDLDKLKISPTLIKFIPR